MDKKKKVRRRTCECGHPDCNQAQAWVAELGEWIDAHGLEQVDWIEGETTLDYFKRRYGASQDVIQDVIGGIFADFEKSGHLGEFMQLINFGIQLEGRRNHKRQMRQELETFLGKDKFEQLNRLLPAATTNAQDNEYEKLS